MSSTGALPIWLTILQKGGRLSDIEFMSVKQFKGKLKKVEGSTSSTGTITSFTPATGKTFYLAGAHVQQVAVTPVTVYSWHAELKNDTTVVDNCGGNGSASFATYSLPQRFELKGDSLVGDGAKTYSINIVSNADGVTLEGMIYGFIENDADDPRL